MKNIILAWRNLWRKPWRTIITGGSVFFGVLFTAFMTSMQYGSYDAMIDNIVKFYTGYMQIFTEDYHENKTINNTFELTDSIMSIIHEEPEITSYAPRLEYFALASSADITKGSIIIGVDPQMENDITSLSKWVKKGAYLVEGDDGILVAKDLATYLKIDVGDSLVLYGQGFHGVMAAGLYRVKGILSFPSPELNKQFIYMDIKTCQSFFSADNMISSLVMMVPDHYHLPKAMKHLKKEIKSPYMVMSWDELQPELVSMIEADNAGGVFMKAILYMIITFGIFGTILMMIAERKREMGVMVAIGMQRAKLGVILFFETLFMGLLGALAGLLASIPITYYFYKNPFPLTGEAAKTFIDMGIEPYMYFSMHPQVFYIQALTVFIITIVIALFPIYKAFTLELTKALRA